MSSKGGAHQHRKYEERILNALNRFLREDLNDSRLKNVSFTKVELSRDYSWVKVYWDTFFLEKRDEMKSAVEGAKGRLRGLLAQQLQMKGTPEIQFHSDRAFEETQNIENLLKDEESSH